MGYFEDELKRRKQKDNAAIEDALYGVAGAVVGRSLRRGLNDAEATNSAVGAILKYYGIKEELKPIPRELKNIDEQLDYRFHPHNIMHRNVHLEKGWRKCAIGPMLASLKGTDTVVALIPHPFFGYTSYCFKTGKTCRVNSSYEKKLDKEAVCFYRPLPDKKLKIRDLLLFMLKQINVGDIAIFITMMVVTTLFGLINPWFTKWLFGFVLESKDATVLFSLATFMTTYVIASLFLACYKTLIESRIGIKINIAIEASVMHRIISLPPNTFAKYSAGEFATRASYVKSMCLTLIETIASTTITSLFSFIYIGQAFAFAPSLATPGIIITIVTVLFSIIVIFVNMRIIKQKMLLESKESGMSYAMITGIQKIKLAGAEKRMFARWAKLYSKSAKLTYNPPFFIKISSVINLAISLCGTLIIYNCAIAGGVSVPDYYAFTSSFAQVSAAISAFTNVAVAIATIKPTYELAKPILHSVPEPTENKQRIASLKGDIELSHVSFRYNDDSPFIFNDFSLRIKPNDYIAIVGKTGCGKSTLVRLLLGFEKPTKGTVSFDRRDLNTVDLKSLRNRIGTVMQDSKMFRGDIYSNIVIAAPWVDMDGAWKAAKIASIDEDIKEMPMGMQTVISEGQGGISGGQRQRLAIARAVVNKPSVIIFDEATSALDNLTQKKVADAIDQLKCTRIIIAHRLSTIKNCKRIIVIDNGHIVEDGTYDELLKQDGLFSELIKRQRLDLSNQDLNKK